VVSLRPGPDHNLPLSILFGLLIGISVYVG
jgi:hypothetical protein